VLPPGEAHRPNTRELVDHGLVSTLLGAPRSGATDVLDPAHCCSDKDCTDDDRNGSGYAIFHHLPSAAHGQLECTSATDCRVTAALLAETRQAESPAKLSAHAALPV
jgi:hypothetical protein